MDRVPAQCLVGHGFNSCWELRLFLFQAHVLLINSLLCSITTAVLLLATQIFFTVGSVGQHY